jgi:hypothetical protein
MDSKDDRGDPKEEVVAKNFMAELVDYCQSASFLSKIDAFMEDNQKYFLRTTDGSGGDKAAFISIDEEQTLEQTRSFDSFQVLIDSLFDKFADNYNISSDLLYENCRDAVENRFMPLFQEDDNKWFVEEVLLNWMDYESFSKTMRSFAVKRLAGESKAEDSSSSFRK